MLPCHSINEDSMKTSLMSTLFIFALICLTGMSSANASTPKLEQFSVKCTYGNNTLYENDSVFFSLKTGQTEFIEFLTKDNRKVYVGKQCVFIQNLPTGEKTVDSEFPEDGEPRYSIGY